MAVALVVLLAALIPVLLGLILYSALLLQQAAASVLPLVHQPLEAMVVLAAVVAGAGLEEVATLRL